MCSYAAHNCGRAELRMSVPAGMIEGASLRLLPPEHLQCPGRGGEEVGAVSEPKGRNAKVRRGKVTARKVSEVLTAVARLIRAVGVLVNALSKWFS